MEFELIGVFNAYISEKHLSFFCHLHNNRENAGCLLQNFHMMIFLFKHVDNLKLNRLIGTIV